MKLNRLPFIFLCLCGTSLLWADDVKADSDANADEVSAESSSFNSTRSWSNAAKTATFEGTVTKYDGKKATITRKGESSAMEVDVSKLCPEDKEWLDEHKDEINASKKKDDKKGDKDDEEKDKGAPNMVGEIIKGKVHVYDPKTKEFIPNEAAKLNADYYIALYSASWCGPCCAEMPNVVKLYKSRIAKDPQIELVHVSCDKTVDAAKEWARSNKMTFPVVLPQDRGATGVVGGSSSNGIPNGVLIDGKTGKVLERGLPSDLHKKYLSLKRK